MISNFAEKLTNEEPEITKNLAEFVKQNQDGFVIDLKPLLNLTPCFGFDEESFELSIENDHIIMSINRSKDGSFKECLLTPLLAKQTSTYVGDLELAHYRFGES